MNPNADMSTSSPQSSIIAKNNEGFSDVIVQIKPIKLIPNIPFIPKNLKNNIVNNAATAVLTRINSPQILITLLILLNFTVQPGEVDPIKAHEIGMELCKKILKEDYEFVLATHVDRGHIHNHIIFNNVNYTTGKCYQSNKKSYHKIRYQSDELCKENKLSVIDEYY